MLYRIFYDSDEGDSGWETVEAPNIAAARRMIQSRLSGIQGLELGNVQDITPSPAGQKGGDTTPPPPSGGPPPSPPGGGSGSPPPAAPMEWEGIIANLEKEIADLQKAAANRQQEFDAASRESEQKWNDLIASMGKYTPPGGSGGSGGSGQSGNPNLWNPDPLPEMDAKDAQTRFLLEGQSPLAAFREGMRGGMGGAPQSYLAKNYLERFVDPARTAYQTLGALGSPMGGAQDFQSFVQNLFSSGGGNVRGQLGDMLGGGLSALAGTGRDDLAEMDPATRRIFEQRINPDISLEGGRDRIADVLNLAYGAQAQRYSPLILQQLRGGLPSQDELYADYVTQTAGGGTGQDPNFARFVQQQFGL